MKNLTTFCEQLTGMVSDYNTRVKAASDRILTLGNELQQAKNAMTAAAEADNMTAYREQEANVRFLTARIEAAKREQVEPLFSSLEEALALDRGYHEAIRKDLAPVYSRLLETVAEQKALIEHLHSRSNALSGAANAINDHAAKVGSAFHAWHVTPILLQHFCNTHVVEACLQDIPNE